MVRQFFHKNIEILEENVRSLNEQTEYFKKVIEQLQEENKELKRRISICMMKEVNTKVMADHNPKAQTATEDVYTGIDYYDFENYFRGSRELIKERQSMYISYFKDKGEILDVGCGRGEFLELLAENGIEAYGVDLYEEFVLLCKDFGLKAFCDDAINAISKAQNLGGIFAGQLIEHLKLEEIVELCRSSYNALKEGGCLILETPNPMTLAIYTNSFYVDPSHQKPVHPMTMKYILEKQGFRDVQIVFSESSRMPFSIPAIEGDNFEEFNKSMKIVENIMFGCQDYAVIAQK